jgi:hypothetical protein
VAQQYETSDTLRKAADDLVQRATQVKEIIYQGKIPEHSDELKTDFASIEIDLEHLKRTTTPSPPLKVRGGAMTVRTEISGNGGWVPKDAAGRQFCTNADISRAYYLTDDGLCHLIQLPPSTNWSMRLHGGSPVTPGNASGRGLVIITQPNQNCTGGVGSSVLMTVFDDNVSTNGKYVRFYSGDQNSDDGKTVRRRFLDRTPDGKTPDKAGCVTPPDGDGSGDVGDEDACERMTKFEIRNLSGSSVSTTPCLNGDCTVFIGTPPAGLNCQ